ncbi:hypothetical protein D3C71_1569140 [compost metagenome]
MNACPGTAGAVLPGAHAQALVGAFVEAAVGVVAGVVDGIGDRALPIVQVRAQTPGAECRGVGLGGQAGFGLEQSVQMKGADRQLRGKLIEVGRGVAGFDQATGTGGQVGATGAAGGLGARAAAAGTIAGGLGASDVVEELDVFALGHA